MWFFSGTNPQELAFKKLKELLVNPPFLSYYDPKKELTLSVDCSSTGLGAIILSENKPIAYAPRALTETQKNYSKIEHEMLATVFGCICFHQYVYGRKVNVESDHKTLESLFKKPLVSAPLRLQHVLLKFQRYNLDVRFKPWKLMYYI